MNIIKMDPQSKVSFSDYVKLEVVRRIDGVGCGTIYAGIFNLKLYFLTVIYLFAPHGNTNSNNLALHLPSCRKFYVCSVRAASLRLQSQFFHIRLSKAEWSLRFGFASIGLGRR